MWLVMPPKVTDQDLNKHEMMSESVTEFSEVLPPPTSSSLRVGGLVVVVLIVS